VLPIENLPLTRVFRVRNRPLQERHRTGLSREQMSLWLAGYPKTPRFDVRFGVNRYRNAVSAYVRSSLNLRHDLAARRTMQRAIMRNGTAAKVGLVANIRPVAVKGVRRNGVDSNLSEFAGFVSTSIEPACRFLRRDVSCLRLLDRDV
jgi:hypothetical protein